MNRFFKLVLAALPLAMMASCSDDEMVVDDGIAKSSETRYLSVSLSSADAQPGSRAEGDPTIPGLEGGGIYNGGIDAENKIRTLDFYFYDINKNFHSYVHYAFDKNSLNPVGDDNNSGDLDPDNNTTKPNIKGFYHCNVPVELIQGETYPRYVICIINAVQSSFYDGKSMAEAQATVLDHIYGADKGKDGKTDYFGMSNSVYYGRDVVSGEENQLIMATPFEMEMLKTEKEINELKQDESKLADYTVNIYVERYAAKVNLDLGGSEANKTPISDYTTGNTNTVELTFEPKAWGINAIEKKFFFIKAFRTQNGETDTYGNSFESFETMNSILFPGWNNADHHRTFWARTPGYYTNDYPIVTDDINKDTEGYKNQYDVDYVSYNDCMKFGAFSGKYYYSQYVRETTMKQQRLTGDGMAEQYLPTASLPSVLLVGQYYVKGKGTEADPVDLYAYGKQNVAVGNTTEERYIFYANDADLAKYTELGLGNIKDKMLDDQTIILKKEEVSTTEAEGKATTTTSWPSYDHKSIGALRDRFEVMHPSAAVRMAATSAVESQANGGGVKVAADIVVLQLKGVTEADNLYFYNAAATTPGYEKITSENIDIANRLLLQNLGGAHLYKDGMAFFYAPIQHWGWYRTASDKRGANPNKDKPMDEWDWKAMRTGDFGVVRNHVYTMKIGSISGLGTAIKDPEEPIVPPADKIGYEVHFHVNIQKWAVLPTQTWNW